MKPKITKQIDGKHVEVPVDDLWDSICKVIRLSRIAVAEASVYGLSEAIAVACESDLFNEVL